jgi:hypothetical protein
MSASSSSRPTPPSARPARAAPREPARPGRALRASLLSALLLGPAGAAHARPAEPPAAGDPAGHPASEAPRAFAPPAAVSPAAAPAHSTGLQAGRWDEGIRWVEQPVRAPVDPDAVRPEAPFVPDRVPQATGEVAVAPGRAAVLWLGPLEVVRVTGEAGSVRFLRVPSAPKGASSRVALEEDGIPARAGVWYLAEPMGSGSAWVVTAGRPVAVKVERPAPASGAKVEEAIRAGLLKWVDGGAELPPLPFHAELRARLEAEAELGAALQEGAAGDAPLAQAVAAWRKASALRAWLLAEPLSPATFRLSRPAPEGAAAVPLEGVSPHFQRPAAGRSEWQLPLSGPGVLALDVRPLLPASPGGAAGGAGAVRVVEVLDGERVLARLDVAPRAAAVPDEAPDALPGERTVRTLPGGEQVGALEQLRVLLRPGRHTYRVRWQGGPLLLRAEAGDRRPWLFEAVKREAGWQDWASRAAGLLAQDASPRAALLRRRLAEMDPALGRASEPALADGSALAALPPTLRALAALEHAASLAGLPGQERARAARLAAAGELLGAGAADSALAWETRLRLARVHLAEGRADAARALLAGAAGFPRLGWQAAQAAELVARLPAEPAEGPGRGRDEALRSREVAALELAWRQEPLSEDIRRRYRAAWWHASRWQRLAPAPRRGGAEAAAVQHWLDLRALQPGEQPGADALWALAAGTTARVRGAGEASTPTVLRAYVLPGAARAEAPLRLKVGGQSFPLLPLSQVEEVEVALPPGEHAVALEGAPEARLLLALAPATSDGAPAAVGQVRTHWPVVSADGRPVRFPVPASRLPSPVRVQLRATGRTDRPVAVRLRTDTGLERRLELAPSPAHPGSLRLDGVGAEAAPPATLVLHLPGGAREVWFEPEDPKAGVVASLAVRSTLPPLTEATRAATASAASGDAAPQGASATATPAPRERSLEALLALSRRLQATPSAAGLLERAELLLALEEEGLAREDVRRVLLSHQALPAAESERLLSLVDRLAAARAPEVRFVQAPSAPTLLSPAASALEGAEAPELAGVAALARTRGPAAALAQLAQAQTPAARSLKARLQARAGQGAPAAAALVQLFRDTGRPQAGLEALTVLEGLEAQGEAWAEGNSAPLGYAVATQLSASWAELPVVRRVRAATARWTQWDRLRDAEANVGSIDALQAGAAGDDEEGAGLARDAVRLALLAPPWALDEVRRVRPGHASVLSVDLPRAQRLGAHVLCSRRAAPPAGGAEEAAEEEAPEGRPAEGARTPAAAPAPCRFVLRVDGAVAQEREVAPGTPVALVTAPLPAGPHQVEVLLAREGGEADGAVRFVSRPSAAGTPAPAPGTPTPAVAAPRAPADAEERALTTLTPLSLLRARPGEPVEMTVLGPTVLRVAGRALVPGEGRTLVVRNERQGAPASGTPVTLALPAALDESLRGTPAPVGRETETLVLLTEPGPHRLRLEAPQGEALVRVRMGVSRRPEARPARTGALAAAGGRGAGEPLPWPALPPPLALLPSGGEVLPAPRELGTLSAELGWRQEDVEDGELLNRPLRTGLEARLGYRHQLVPERLWLRVEPLVRMPLESAPVLGGSAGLFAARLPLGLRAQASASAFGQSMEGSFRYALRGRAALDRFFRLDPDLGLIPSLALDLERFGGAGGTATEFDRSVFWRYGLEHPQRLTPRLTLRWTPFQDVVGRLSGFAISNADFATLDQYGGAMKWAALLGGPLQGARASLGYDLTWRPVDLHREQAYLRHRVAGRLDYAVWTGASGRLLLFAEDQVLASQPFGLQNVLGLGVRWDWTGGRGLRDVLPYEEEFEDVLDTGRSID